MLGKKHFKTETYTGGDAAVLAHCLCCFAQARGGSHPALPYFARLAVVIVGIPADGVRKGRDV